MATKYAAKGIVVRYGAPASITSITRSGATATVTTGSAHGRSTGDWVLISGATGTDAGLYNILAQITNTGASTFTYVMAGTPTGSAAGTLTFTYAGTALAQVRSVSVSPGERPMIETTTHDSSSTKDYLANPLRDTAELEVTLAWDPDDAGHEVIRAAHAAGTRIPLAAIFPNSGAGRYDLAGIVTKLSPPNLGTDGLLEATFSYKADMAEGFTQ